MKLLKLFIDLKKNACCFYGHTSAPIDLPSNMRYKYQKHALYVEFLK